MTSLVRIEFILDSAHRGALETFLRDHGLNICVFAEHVEAPSFDTALLGASRVVAFARQEPFDAARADLTAFLRTCGGIAFTSRTERVE